MKTWWIPISLTVVLLYVLVGCTPSPIVLHPGFGNSVSWARQNQVYNTAASENLDPTIGLHGRSASNAMVQYEKAFTQKQKPSGNIGLLVTPGGQ